MSGRDVARRVVRRAASNDSFATLALSGEIERANLDGREAALATELALGTLRNQRRIDVALAASSRTGKVDLSSKVRAIVRVAGYEILFCDGIPPRASVDEAAKATRAVAGGKVAGFVNALLRKLASSGEPAFPADARQRVAIEHSLPDWLVDEIEQALGEPSTDELDLVAAAMSVVPAVCLRANRTRTTVAALCQRLAAEAPAASLERHPFASAAIRAERLGPIAELPAFRDGWFTVQDAGAQRVAELVDPRGVESIIDVCAGVGGKTTHLAELFNDRVPIDAADVSASKLEKLLESARRLGLQSIRKTYAADFTLPPPVEQTYDVVLLDAPCSGLGVLRRHPEAKWRLGRKTSIEMAALQRALLTTCLGLVAPGGQLIYSVCTFTPREGRELIAAFVAEHGELELAAEMTSWPHRDDADAFYAARLVKA